MYMKSFTLTQDCSHKLQSFTLSSSVIISLCHFDKILEVNPETKIARFQGGVVIHKLAEGEYIISMPYTDIYVYQSLTFGILGGSFQYSSC